MYSRTHEETTWQCIQTEEYQSALPEYELSVLIRCFLYHTLSAMFIRAIIVIYVYWVVLVSVAKLLETLYAS